jgi:gas vesicle protein
MITFIFGMLLGGVIGVAAMAIVSINLGEL